MAIAYAKAVTTSVQTGHNLMYGWEFRETAGSTAVITLRDGGAAGVIGVSISLGANESVGESYEHPLAAIDATTPLWYAKVESGTVVGAVYGSHKL